MNPYEELDIPLDASEDEVKKAFRDLSKQHHPDAGGDKEKFQKLNNAYLILKDPEKRKYFDEHGDEKPKTDPIFSKAMSLFSKMVEDTIDGYGEDIIYKDIIADMTKAVNKNLKGLNRERDECNKDIAHMNKKHEMFNRKIKFKQEKGKVNMFDFVIQTRVEAIRNKINNLNEQETILTMILDWVSDFTFDFEKRPEGEESQKQAQWADLRQKLMIDPDEIKNMFNDMTQRRGQNPFWNNRR